MSTWHFLSGITSLFSALGLCLIVLNKGVNEGFVIKLGLIGMIFALLVTFALTANESVDWEAYWRASFILRSSLLVVCIGLVIRARKYVERIEADSQIDIPIDAQEGVTRAILRKITEPARDLAHLLNADTQPGDLEQLGDKRRREFWNDS